MTHETPTLNLDSIVSRSQDLLSADMGGEVVMLDLQQSAYFGMDKVGSRIWEMLDQPIRISDLCATLQTQFSVAAEECQPDVLEFLNGLYESKLLNVHLD